MTSTNTEPRTPLDEQIVHALLRDVDAGFDELFRAYRHVVFAAAVRVCRRGADAEDLTAEAFLRAYRALSGYRRARIMALRPRSWLLTIALNLWRNDLRKANRRPPCDPLGESAADPADIVANVERVVTRRETDRELTDLLAALPDEQRVAVVLRHVADLSVAEIASVLGRPANTVKSDIFRGLRRLRDLYPLPPGGHRGSHRTAQPETLGKVLSCRAGARSPADPLRCAENVTRHPR